MTVAMQPGGDLEMIADINERKEFAEILVMFDFNTSPVAMTQMSVDVCLGDAMGDGLDFRFFDPEELTRADAVFALSNANDVWYYDREDLLLCLTLGCSVIWKLYYNNGK